MRVAWFSPLPPVPSGIAAYTAEVAPLLGSHLQALDLYHDQTGSPPAIRGTAFDVLPASTFVYRHRRQPYDVIVYQLGNSSAHDYMWAYAFRYPGLLVLHDAQVHQARALHLLRRLEPRLDDYLAEVRANHPDAPPDVGYLLAAGLGGSLYRLWPHVALLLAASRLTAVHNARLAETLRRAHPDAAIAHLDMGTTDPLAVFPADTGDAASAAAPADAARHVRGRFGIPDEAVVVGAYGGLTPEKRIPQLLEALHAHPSLHALLVGQRAGHYDVDADVHRLGLEGRVHLTGYVSDADLPAHLAAADVCWCLRWPSNGETSASWIRCLGAGRPTLMTDLAQLRDVATLRVDLASGRLDENGAPPDALGIAVDPADEAREIPVALAVLAHDAALRARLGDAARRYWLMRHTLPQMVERYLRLLDDTSSRPVPAPPLPAHLLDDGSGALRRILGEMGQSTLPW